MRRVVLLVFLFFIPCCAEIRAILFDHGGVMVSLDNEIMLQCLESRMNIPRENLRGYSRKAIMTGAVDEAEFWNEIARGCLPDDWEVHFQQSYIEASRPNPGMSWLVQHLARHGYQVALLSNAFPSGVAANEMEGRYHHFNPVIISCEVGMAKPAPEIYHYALELLELEAEECLFIDDKVENLVPAAALGMEVLHFTSFDQLCQELHRMGILHN